MEIVHAHYAILVRVYSKEGGVAVLETKHTRQRASLPAHAPLTATPLQGHGCSCPGLDASPGSGKLKALESAVLAAWGTCMSCTRTWSEESGRGFLEKAKLSRPWSVWNVWPHLFSEEQRCHNQELEGWKARQAWALCSVHGAAPMIGI